MHDSTTVSRLRGVSAALDRRGPRADRAREAASARDAADLETRALARLDPPVHRSTARAR